MTIYHEVGIVSMAPSDVLVQHCTSVGSESAETAMEHRHFYYNYFDRRWCVATGTSPVEQLSGGQSIISAI